MPRITSYRSLFHWQDTQLTGMFAACRQERQERQERAPAAQPHGAGLSNSTYCPTAPTPPVLPLPPHGVKYGHYVDSLPSGVLCGYKVQGVRSGGGAADVGAVCPAKPAQGCGECVQCRRSEMKRGEVKGFSPSARRRFKRSLMAVPWNKLVAQRRRVGFLTLTVPGLPQAQALKRGWLRAFEQRLLRQWPGLAAVWRLEYQARGSPHVHLLLAWPGEGPQSFLAWAIESWSAITGAPCQSVDYSWCHSWRALLAYISDTGKLSQAVPPETVDQETGEITTQAPGRYWGKWGSYNALMQQAARSFGRAAYDKARRLATKVVCQSIRQARRRKGKVFQARSGVRVNSAFLVDVEQFLTAVGPFEGPAAGQGLDSVYLGHGQVKTWQVTRWT